MSPRQARALLKVAREFAGDCAEITLPTKLGPFVVRFAPGAVAPGTATGKNGPSDRPVSALESLGIPPPPWRNV